MIKTFATALIILCSVAANALPLVWRADWPGAKPVETLVHRGTDIELQPQWYINGELAASSNWTFQTFVQTNAQATGEWFGPLPGAAFSHTNDVGAAFYNVMVRAQMPEGGVNYTAFARLRMLDSPGYAPGALPLPVASIDFSQVVAVNAPWLLPDATNGFIKVEVDPTVPAWAKGATPPLPPDYAAVSNLAYGAATKADATLEYVAAPSPAHDPLVFTPSDEGDIFAGLPAPTNSALQLGAQEDRLVQPFGEYVNTLSDPLKIGIDATAAGTGSAAVGVEASAPSTNALAIGTRSYAGGIGAIAIGAGARANANGAVQLGYSTTTNTTANSLRFRDTVIVQNGKIPNSALAGSFVPTSRKVNGEPLTSDVTITASSLGIDNYASVSNAAMNAATKADATLSTRTAYTSWTTDPAEVEVYLDTYGDYVSVPVEVVFQTEDAYGNAQPGYYLYVEYVAQDRLSGFVPSETDTMTEFTAVVMNATPGHITARRSPLPGYQLGGDTEHILAAQSDLSALAAEVPRVAQASTNYTDAATNALAATIPTTAADVGAYPASNGEQLAGQVAAIGGMLNGEDARFVSTNYDSVVRLPEAYVELKISNDWITVWQEMRRWNDFTGLDFNWTGWDGFNTWKTNVESELSFKADRAWGAYDSETGGYSPEGYTQISSSNILIAAGMAYQRTVTSGGSVWVLQCNQGSARLGGDTNGFFRVFDGDGNVQFEIVKGDKREVGADASGITVGSGSPPVVTIPYSVEAAEHPTIQCCDNLATANWKAETDGDCIANVSWSGTSGAYVATVQRKTAGTALFVKATYMTGGDTYINNVAPTKMDSIILNGTKYYLGTATINGNTVLTLSTTAP